MAGYIKTIKQNADVIYPVTTAEAVIGLGAGGYSTEEAITNSTWVDGKTIYKKTISFGALPNATTKTVAHGISGISHIIDMKAVAWNSSGTTIVLPYAHPQSVQYQVSWHVDNTNINIITGDDKSGYSSCYVTLYYTKS